MKERIGDTHYLPSTWDVAGPIMGCRHAFGHIAELCTHKSCKAVWQIAVVWTEGLDTGRSYFLLSLPFRPFALLFLGLLRLLAFLALFAIFGLSVYLIIGFVSFFVFFPFFLLRLLFFLLPPILYLVLNQIMERRYGSYQTAQVYCHQLIICFDAHCPGQLSVVGR